LNNKIREKFSISAERHHPSIIYIESLILALLRQRNIK